MIVVDIRLQDAAQMPLVKDDDIVEDLTSDTPDAALTIGILPRRSWRNFHLFDAHVADSRLPIRAVDGVPIPQEVTRGTIPGKGLDDLLGRPLGRGMCGDVQVHNPSAFMRQHDEGEEHVECRSRDSEEVTCHNVLDMIVEKGPPGWR